MLSFDSSANLSTLCASSTINKAVYQLIFFTGIFASTLTAIVSFFITNIGPKLLICTLTCNQPHTHIHQIKCTHFPSLCFVVDTWLPLVALVSLSIAWLSEFHLILMAYVLLISSGNAAQILGAISVNLFPSNIR